MADREAHRRVIETLSRKTETYRITDPAGSQPNLDEVLLWGQEMIEKALDQAGRNIPREAGSKPTQDVALSFDHEVYTATIYGTVEHRHYRNKITNEHWHSCFGRRTTRFGCQDEHTGIVYRGYISGAHFTFTKLRIEFDSDHPYDFPLTIVVLDSGHVWELSAHPRLFEWVYAGSEGALR